MPSYGADDMLDESQSYKEDNRQRPPIEDAAGAAREAANGNDGRGLDACPSGADAEGTTYGARSCYGDAHTSEERARADVDSEDSVENAEQAADDDDDDDEEEPFADWLERYRIGRAGPADRAPEPPASIRAILEGRTPNDPLLSDSTSTPRRSSSISTSSNHTSDSSLPSLNAITASTLLDFYRRKGHFPAPPGPFEEERLRLAHKYGLDQPIRRQAIDRICALAKSYFRTKTVVISLTFDDHQVLGAEKGWGGEEPGLDVPPRPLTMEPAFCTHAMLASYRDPKAVFMIADADQDWRFRKNPYTVGNGGGVGFYAAANVNLPTLKEKERRQHEAALYGGCASPAPLDLPETLASGAVCLIDPVPRSPDSFTADDRQALTAFADMISLEFQRGYEHRRREQEAQQSDFIGKFLRQALVLPAQPHDPTAGAGGHHGSSSNGSSETPPDDDSVFATAARELRRLTHAGSACLLDLRAFKPRKRSRVVIPLEELSASPFHSPSVSDDSYRPTFSRSDTIKARPGSRTRARTRSSREPSAVSWTPAPETRGSVSVLSADGDVDWSNLTKEIGLVDRLGDAADETLIAYEEDGAALPENSKIDANAFVRGGIVDAKAGGASIALPIFDDDGAPVMMIVLTSGEKWFTFETVDRQFTASVGAIVVGSMLRQRALEADRAKLRFVGHVSHELRTPLHGCTSQIDLIREFASPEELRKLAPLLDAADVCLESLSDVLNDTLDFSKLSNAAALSPAEVAAQQMRAVVATDLHSLVEGVTKSVWVRKRRVELVSTDAEQGDNRKRDEQVDLLLDVSDRPAGWRAMADVGGLKRCLLNVVGNSLKFTPKGRVEIALRDAGPVTSATPRQYSPPLEETVEKRLIEFIVTDTGVGMTEEFLRDRKYLTPFIQADTFASGAGLGLSIVDTIIRRMGGRLDVSSEYGVGTIMKLSVPIDVISPANDKQGLYDHAGATSTRRNISAELAQVAPATPGVVSPSFARLDFDTAVDSSQKVLERAVHEPDPPLRPSSDPEANERANLEALAVNVAKLNLSTVVTSHPTVTVPMRDPLLPISPPRPTFTIPEKPKREVRVLIAEDNPISRNILVKLLSGKGIPFSATEDGQEALEAFEAGEGSFSLFLADVQMPRLDGIAASRAMRQLEEDRGWPRCRIVALTGLSTGSEMQETVAPHGPLDSWLVKGGKSLRAILDEIKELQARLEQEDGLR